MYVSVSEAFARGHSHRTGIACVHETCVHFLSNELIVLTDMMVELIIKIARFK